MNNNNVELRYDVSDKHLEYLKKQLDRKEINYEVEGTLITFKKNYLQGVGEALERAVEENLKTVAPRHCQHCGKQ